MKQKYSRGNDNDNNMNHKRGRFLNDDDDGTNHLVDTSMVAMEIDHDDDDDNTNTQDGNGTVSPTLLLLDIKRLLNVMEEEGRQQIVNGNNETAPNDTPTGISTTTSTSTGVAGTTTTSSSSTMTNPSWEDKTMRFNLLLSLWKQLQQSSPSNPNNNSVGVTVEVEQQEENNKVFLQLQKRINQVSKKFKDDDQVMSSTNNDDIIDRIFCTAVIPTITPPRFKTLRGRTQNAADNTMLDNSSPNNDEEDIDSNNNNGNVDEKDHSSTRPAPVRQPPTNRANATTTATTSTTKENTNTIDAVQDIQRQQIEDAIGHMAEQMKRKTQQLHTTIQQQTTSLLSDMEVVAEENHMAVTQLAQDTTHHVQKSWHRSLHTYMTMIVIGIMFVVTILIIIVIPKEKQQYQYINQYQQQVNNNDNNSNNRQLSSSSLIPSFISSFFGSSSRQREPQGVPVRTATNNGDFSDWPSEYQQFLEQPEDDEIIKPPDNVRKESVVTNRVPDDNNDNIEETNIQINSDRRDNVVDESLSSSSDDRTATNDSNDGMDDNTNTEIASDEMMVTIDDDETENNNHPVHEDIVVDNEPMDTNNDITNDVETLRTEIDDDDSDTSYDDDEDESNDDGENDNNIPLPEIEYGSFQPIDVSIAAATGQIPLLKAYLLQKRAWINYQDANGWAPVHEATVAGQFKSIQVLIKEGCSVTLPTREHHTAFDLAIQRYPYNHPIVTILAKAMKIENVQSYYSPTTDNNNDNNNMHRGVEL